MVGPGTIGLLAVSWAAPRGRPAWWPSASIAATKRRPGKMGATDFLTAADDPAAAVREMTAGAGADVVFEAAGSDAAVTLALTSRGAAAR